MGEIPGLDFEPPTPVDRTRLKHADAVPRVRSFEIEGRVRESLSWDYPEGDDEDGTISTSASPAHSFAYGYEDEGVPTATLLTRLWEALEQPGEPSDYHFAIQGIAAALWRRRLDDPHALPWHEYLNWLDIRLVRAFPDAVRDEYAEEHPGRSQFYSVTAFRSLVDLYSREGFLHEALAVARIAREFEQGDEAVAELEERLALLRVEDGD
jgi:hypothetical protein